MDLIVILIVLGLRQFWEGNNPLHKDSWFVSWQALLLQKLQSVLGERDSVSILSSLFAVLLPVLALAWVSCWLPWPLALVLAIVVLSYCLGRGGYNDIFAVYKRAVAGSEWDKACQCLDEQKAERVVPSIGEPLAAEEWDQLHKRMLTALGYQGFERFFAVFFWFILFGPAGALLYRLSVHNVVLVEHSEKDALRAGHWLWALEWIPARLLAISFALTGNFVGCVNKLQRVLLDTMMSSARAIQQTVLGALSLDDVEVESDVVTLREVGAMKQLLTRTLWLWLAALALFLLFTG